AQAPPPPARSEAYETRIVIAAVADGHVFGMGVPAHPAALDPLQPLLTPLSIAMGKALEHPVRSLALDLELPSGLSRSGAVAAVLHLKNDGSEGFWASNPLAMTD